MNNTMKMFPVACVLALAAIAAADELKVVDDYDFHALLKDKPRWKSSLGCLLDKAPCGELQALKEGVVQRLKTKCGQCTPAQLEKYKLVLKGLQDQYPEDYKEIMKNIDNH